MKAFSNQGNGDMYKDVFARAFRRGKDKIK